MVAFKQCCFCCDLRTGGVILGWIGAVSNLFAIVISSVFLSKLADTEDSSGYLFMDAKSAGMEFLVKNLLAVGLTMAIVKLATCVFLIMGANKNNHLMVLPWLIENMVEIVTGVMTVFTAGGIFLSNGDSAGVIILIFGTLVNGIALYIWICILSLYQYLRDQAKMILPLNMEITAMNSPVYNRL